MTPKEAIDRIAELLSLKFAKHSFATTSLTDGTEITNNLDEEFKIGQELFVVNESTLSPAPEGKHETREGLVLTVDSSSVIIAIEQKATEAPANEDGNASTETTQEGMEEEVAVEVPEAVSDVLTEDVVQAVVEALAPVVEEVKAISEEMKKLKEKMQADYSALKTDFESFKKQPEKFSVAEVKKTFTDTALDYKLDVIKGFKRK